jgi:hypothetical protein
MPQSLPRQAPVGESLHTGITSWAAHAPRRLLTVITAVGAVGAPITLLIATEGWLVVGFLVTGSCIGAWGLLEQHGPAPHLRWLVAAQWLLVAIGTLATIVSGLGLFFRMMGPAPIL